MAQGVESVKIIDAKQAKTTHRFKNIKLKYSGAMLLSGSTDIVKP